MQLTPVASSQGFSLIEALLASLLVASAIAGLAHLIALAADQTLGVRRHVSALVSAQSKLEELRTLPWTYAPDGTRVSDAGLAPSPPGSLLSDSSGSVDRLDDSGRVLEGPDSGAPASVRRWAISLREPEDPDSLVLQVCVFGVHALRASSVTAADACVASVRVREP